MKAATVRFSSRFSYNWLTEHPLKIPIDKTRLILAYLGVNYLIVFVDVLIAHSLGGLFPVYEWIPIIYSPFGALAAFLLLLNPHPGWEQKFHILMMTIGIFIGLLGLGFHLQGASAGNVVSLAGLINASPIFAPVAFIALGSIGALTAMDDHPDIRKYGLTQKTRWLLLITAFWFFATAAVAFLDHARAGFTNLYTWIPIYSGFFAGIVLALQAYSKPDNQLSFLLGFALALNVAVGILGFSFHLSVDLAGCGYFDWVRLFYHAPFLAPLLFSDLGIWGALIFLDPLPAADIQPVEHTVA